METMTLREALMTCAVYRDVTQTLHFARIALIMGTPSERAVAVSACTLIGGVVAAALRAQLVAALGWHHNVASVEGLAILGGQA